jgi:UDP-3-O-[3-hydroxymyristoyl] glucosamine N-acyltransferase
VAHLRLSQLCELLKEASLAARLEGDDRVIRGVNTLSDASDGELGFLSNPKYLRSLEQTRASAVILPDQVPSPSGLSTIRCSDPYSAVTLAIVHLHGHRQHPKWGLSERATIHPSAKIGANPCLAPGVTIAADAVIGDDCVFYPGCYIGCSARIGNGCVLFPNVVVYDGCVLGNRVTIHAGSVIGEDGLGYAPRSDRWVKIPQVGRAVIGDDVEIGANCTIDRATLGQTEIGAGTKFGNVIVIGHGTKVGPDCLFVGLVGVAGSVTVGKHVTLAGQVGIAGHCSIGDNVRAGAQSGIAGDIEEGSEVFGSPAMPIENARRSLAVVPKLPELMRRLRDLEREVKDLRKQLNDRAECNLSDERRAP